ncbi:MAG: CRTAC1 family protein [Flavobacteriales bacterium]|nr:CRTAC1 family protein [Flavobacteriales bacterium]
MRERFIGYKISLSALVFLTVHFAAFAQDFENVSNSSGIQVQINNPFYGTGLSFADFDGDGLDDITIARDMDSPEVFRNLGDGTFENAGLLQTSFDEVKSILWIDYDQDGDNDVFMTNFAGIPQLLRNDGDYTFTNVTAMVGLPNDPANYYGGTWADFDRDGDYDLYISKYRSLDNPDDVATAADRNTFLRNDNGIFTDISVQSGTCNEIELTFMGIWVDVNHDLWPDLYLINDKVFPNRLYKNDGNGGFDEITFSSGTDIAIDAMTGTYGDYNRDGNPDIHCTNTTSGPNSLLEYIAPATFTDVGVAQGLPLDKYTWGSTFIDIDNDRDLDLYIAESNPLNQNQPNILLENTGAENGYTFVDGSNHLLSPENSNAYAVAMGDINNDGFRDIIVGNEAPNNVVIWQNTASSGNNYIEVRLHGEISNTHGTGSWITVYSNNMVLTEYTMISEQYISQNSFDEHFGLGQGLLCDSIIIEWPSGWVDTFYDVSANQTLIVNEGESVITAVNSESDYFCSGDSVQLFTYNNFPGTWSNGVTAQNIWVTEPGNYSYTSVNNFGLTLNSEIVNISEIPANQITSNTTPTTCFGDSDGAVSIESQIGITSILLDGASVDAEINDLSAGTYEIQVIDNFGCSTSSSFEIESPDPITIEFVIDSIPCFGEEGNVEAIVSGGNGDYTIEWSVEDPENVGPGEWSAMVTDLLLCTGEATFELIEPSEISISGESQPSTEGDNGSIMIDIEGGTEPYTYNWSGPDGFSSDEEDLTGIAPGVYTCIVTDDNGCFEIFSESVSDVSVYTIEQQLVVVYPNPADDALHVTSADKPVLKNMLGQTIELDWVFVQSEWLTSLPFDLAEGVYLVLTNSGQQRVIIRK